MNPRPHWDQIDYLNAVAIACGASWCPTWWRPALRIAYQTLLGLGSASLFALAARRALGPERARAWLGA